MDDTRIVECGKRRAYAVEEFLFSSKGRSGSSISLLSWGRRHG
ncbi:MAG: hypothetical protein ACLUIQ_05920 [Dialister invisus]